MPAIIGTLISRRLATIVELQTILGAQDAYDLLEIVVVDDYNKSLLQAPR